MFFFTSPNLQEPKGLFWFSKFTWEIAQGVGFKLLRSGEGAIEADLGASIQCEREN